MAYEEPVIEIIVVSNENILTSTEHDNSFFNFTAWFR